MPASARSPIPEILARPPWKRPKKERPERPRRDGLEIPSYPSSCDLELDEPPEPRPEIEKNMLGAPGGRRDMLVDLKYCGDDVALRAFLEHAPEEWVYTNVDHVRHVLARFGAKITAPLVAYGELHPDHAAELYIHLDAPEPALTCARWIARGTALATQGRAWLLAHPEAAVVGLVPSALGPPGKDRAAAETALRIVADADADAVESACGRYDEAVAHDVAALLETPPIWSFPAKIPKLPKWWDASALPTPRLRDGTPLDADAVDAIGMMLRFTPVDPPYPGLEIVRDVCDPRSLDDLVWGIVELWLNNGASANAYWALHAVGHLGADYAVGRLAGAIFVWPRQRGLARAKLGCEVLARIGSDTALAHLDRIARSVRKAAVRRHAEAAIEEIARRRGLSRDDLEDRLVPDLGLEADGTMTLDLGPRTLSVRFDENLAPYLVDADGDRLARLSKRKTDDAERAKSAAKRWKALQKDAAAIAKSQVARLERRMVEQKRWPLQTFETLFVTHPLLGHLSRRLLFARYEAGAPASFFRVSVEGEYLDVDDEPLTMAPAAPIAIAHPLHLGDDVARWAEVFADYELVQPFPQLGRPVARPSADALERRDLPEFTGRRVWTKVLFGLEPRGWKQGAIEEGWLHTFYKSLGRRRTAVLRFSPGMQLSDAAKDEAQTIEHVRLLSNHDFSSVEPVAYSELVADLEGLSGPD